MYVNSVNSYHNATQNIKTTKSSKQQVNIVSMPALHVTRDCVRPLKRASMNKHNDSSRTQCPFSIRDYVDSVACWKRGAREMKGQTTV